MPASSQHFAIQLARRRRDLGMSITALSRRSGVSVPTIRRLLEGRIGAASFSNVVAVAETLGAPIEFVERDVEDVRTDVARKKAEQVARLVQGTSGLEGQAVDAGNYRRLVERSTQELLVGSKRRLWAE